MASVELAVPGLDSCLVAALASAASSALMTTAEETESVDSDIGRGDTDIVLGEDDFVRSG